VHVAGLWQVEDSMENLLDVVTERDIAYSELETGESCAPGQRWAYHELGIGYWQKCKPHPVPLHMNTRFRRTTALSGQWQHHYMKLRREKLMGSRHRNRKRLYAKHRAYAAKFPDTEIETDYSEYTKSLMDSLKKATEEQWFC